jgi:hypothetical protein
MHKPTIFLTLLFALGMYSIAPVISKFGPLAATAAHAENDNDSDGVIYSDDVGGDDNGGTASDDGSNEENEDSDNVGVVGSSSGPIFDEGAASSLPCKEPACKVK